MIPFAKTTLGQEEKEAVSKVIDSGWVVLGPKSQEFEEKFAEYVGGKYAVFVDSGTAALFLAAKWTFAPKEIVKVPSLTFVSTAEIVKNMGAEIRFVDVKDDLTIPADENSIPVHIAGNRAADGALMYDSAHRIEKDDVKNSKALWCYSFYATKNMTTVQGGMVVTNDKDAYEWLKKARDHGLTLGTKERYHGTYKQYDIDFIGYRLKGDDLRAAIGIEQLKKLPQNTERRNEIVHLYNKKLGLKRTGNHLYYVFVKHREHFVNQLFNEGIQTAIHFRPLHHTIAYSPFNRDNLHNTEWFGSNIVSLPLYPQMTNEEVEFIANKVLETSMLEAI